MEEFDWTAFVEDNRTYGDPGFANLGLARLSDANVTATNPCGEQFLEDKEACNLVEIFPARFGDFSPHVAIKLMTRFAIRQRVGTLLDPESDEVGRRNMRVGLGLGGVCDFEWTPKMLRDWFHTARTEATEYALEQGLNVPITVTTTKPSGTISLLNGSSPGIHAPFAPFYVRRMVLGSHEPLADVLDEAGVHSEQSAYDASGRQRVFEFPMRAEASEYVGTQTAISQLERQVAVQSYWADNAVSATITFKPDEMRDVAAYLRQHAATKLKSSSLLCDEHSYEQAPYEAIEESAYISRMGQIRSDVHLPGEVDFSETDFDLEGCVGQVCPTR